MKIIPKCKQCHRTLRYDEKDYCSICYNNLLKSKQNNITNKNKL